MMLTAYPEAEVELGRQIREAALDHDAFLLPLKLCELGVCRASCCHDGVLLGADESRVIRRVIEAGRQGLEGYEWFEEDYLIEEKGGIRSRTLIASEQELAEDFPKHFPRTRCVFLDQGHRCVLQRLAMDEGRHPWFWKPISCWMHPLLLVPKGPGGRPILTLAGPENDPAAREGYAGFSAYTPCGTRQVGGFGLAEGPQAGTRAVEPVGRA